MEEFCVTGPNATCVRDWCRENASNWMPEVFDILDKANDTLTIQIDALSPDFLGTILQQSISDERVVDMHVENCASLGLDGKFTSNKLSVRPSIIIAGLYSKDPNVRNLDKTIEDKWESWGFINDYEFGNWAPRYVVFTPEENNQYRMMRVNDPIKFTVNAPGSSFNREEAISVASALMSNSMPAISLINAKLFFSFKADTKPWTFKKRKGLAALLNTLTRKTEEDVFGCWLTKIHPGAQESEWHFPPLGPCQPVWVGAVHVASDQYTWHSVMQCNIHISEDPRRLHDPIHIDVTTTW